MTASNIIKLAISQHPNSRFAVHYSGLSVAGWDSTLGRWVPIAGKTITGKWCAMPYELMANGKPLHKQEDWREVTA